MSAISVIVPVYKAEPYIRRCVKSILKQCFTDFELILVDDGTPDKSGESCDDFLIHDSRITVIHKQNGGVSSARNVGLKSGVGNYYMFCDSDDWVHPQWCEIMYTEAKEHPNNLIAHDIVRAAGEEVFDFSVTYTVDEIDYFGLYKKGISAYVFNKVFERSIIKRNGLFFDETCSVGEDVRFICCYMEYVQQPVYFVDSKLYFYFSNPDSIMNRYYNNWMQLHLPLFYMRIPYMSNHISKYCDIWVWQFINMLDHVFDYKNTMNLSQKLRYNQRMLNSKEVRFCFEHASWKNESPIIKRILMTYNYYLYYVFNRIEKLLKKDEEDL